MDAATKSAVIADADEALRGDAAHAKTESPDESSDADGERAVVEQPCESDRGGVRLLHDEVVDWEDGLRVGPSGRRRTVRARFVYRGPSRPRLYPDE